MIVRSRSGPRERIFPNRKITPMASVDVEMVKCACPDCVCVVSLSKAVTRDDKAFCCDECAEGHPDHAGCDHAGCTCLG